MYCFINIITFDIKYTCFLLLKKIRSDFLVLLISLSVNGSDCIIILTHTLIHTDHYISVFN